MSTETDVQLNPGVGGSLVRTRELVLGGKTVEQQVIADVYNSGQCLPDQAGSSGVLTFTFAAAVDMVVILSKGGVSRADPFGGTPSSSQGVYCDDGVPSYMPVTATVIKVYAPTGAEVSVWGFIY